jgi:hypothetical protein
MFGKDFKPALLRLVEDDPHPVYNRYDNVVEEPSQLDNFCREDFSSRIVPEVESVSVTPIS